jgi:pimeloyl-ACP methyl ester carboxylesterase
MSISTRQHTIITSHGSLAVEESGQGSIPVLLIHGNSSCRGVFRHQLQGRLAQIHRLIAFDLPGHGQSSNAPDPTQSYTHQRHWASIAAILRGEERGFPLADT